MIKRLASQGVGVMAGMALGGGLYRNRFQVRRIQDLWYFARAWKNHRADIKRGKALRFIDQEKGWTGGELAISWVLRNPDISCAIFGTTRMTHLMANLQASGKPVDARILHQISKAQLSFG